MPKLLERRTGLRFNRRMIKRIIAFFGSRGPGIAPALLGLVAIGAVTDAGAASLQQCVAGLQNAAVKSGVSQSIAAQALADVQFNERAVRFSRTQPEHHTPIWDYMAFLVDDDRIETGHTMLRRHGRMLAAVEKAYGVNRYIVAALWGIESNYGADQGDFFIPHSLANIVCAGRRPDFFRNELIQALKLVSRGDLKLNDLHGSWAGAFGQTQFIPSTYQRLAVDFDGDGRRDLVNSEADALASAANYLKRAGWRSGEPWGFEVRLPAGYSGPSGRGKKAPLSSWAKRSLTHADGRRIKGSANAALIAPAGVGGPAFLVFSNFNALYSYNSAESYALAIGHLSDRLRGGGGLATAWPTDDPGLSRAQRLELQRLLIRHGYDIGEADGRIGPLTQAAIKQAEAKLGLPQTGRPGTRIYRALGGR